MTALIVQLPLRESQRPRPQVAFTAIFRGEAGDEECLVTSGTFDDLPEAARFRAYAIAMMKAAQAFLREAEAIEPKIGAPVALVRLHTRGIEAVAVRGQLMAAGDELIDLHMDDAKALLKRIRGGMTGDVDRLR